MKGFGGKAGVGRTDHKGSAARREARTPPSLRVALLEVQPSDLDLCLVWCLGMRLEAGALGAPDTDWFVVLAPVVPDRVLWRGQPPVLGPGLPWSFAGHLVPCSLLL